ncbi:MAG: hypothetical protein EZS28_046306, partial [Streblomastix strix]
NINFRQDPDGSISTQIRYAYINTGGERSPDWAKWNVISVPGLIESETSRLFAANPTIQAKSDILKAEASTVKLVPVLLSEVIPELPDMYINASGYGEYSLERGEPNSGNRTPITKDEAIYLKAASNMFTNALSRNMNVNNPADIEQARDIVTNLVSSIYQLPKTTTYGNFNAEQKALAETLASIDANTQYTADGIPVVKDTPEQAKLRSREKLIEGMQKRVSDLDVSQNFNGEFGDISKYTKYGVTPNLIDKDLDWLRAKNQSAFAQFWNGIVVQGGIGEVVGQTIAGFGAIPDKLASYFTKDAYEEGKTFSNPLSEFGDKITNWTREVAPIYEEHPDGGIHGDSGYIASRMPSLLSSISLMIPGLTYTKGLSAAGKALAKAGKAVVGAERVSAAAQTIAKATRNMGKVGKAMDTAYNST